MRSRLYLNYTSLQFHTRFRVSAALIALYGAGQGVSPARSREGCGQTVIHAATHGRVLV